MKKILTLTLATLLSASALSAALPPLYQSRNEMVAVLQDEEVLKSFPSGDIIEGIHVEPITTENGMHASHAYVLSSKSQDVIIGIIYENQEDTKRIGPAKFRVEILSVTKKQSTPAY